MTTRHGPHKAAEEIAARMARGRAPTPEEYRTMRQRVVRYVNRRFGIDAEDITDEAVVKFLRAAREERIHGDSPFSYLMAIAHNEAVDRIRRHHMDGHRRRHVAATDDDIAALLDARADAQTVEGALRRAALAGDHACTRVVNEWLRLAEQESRSPSSRAVAIRINVSHVTVQACLSRFRQYIVSEQAEGPHRP